MVVDANDDGRPSSEDGEELGRVSANNRMNNSRPDNTRRLSRE